MNLDFSKVNDELLAFAAMKAIEDKGIDKLRALCWLVVDVKEGTGWESTIGQCKKTIVNE